MTVKELIEQLKTLDADLTVMVRGYEGGFADIDADKIKHIPMVLNYHDSLHYGDHEEYYDYMLEEDEKNEYTIVNAVVLDRF